MSDSNWPIVYKCSKTTSGELKKIVRQVFLNYGAPMKITTDGATYFLSREFEEFVKIWKIQHIISSAHHAHSNLRSEAAVRSVKKIVHENIDKTGSLDSNKFAMAMLQYRNTPCRFLGGPPLAGPPLELGLSVSVFLSRHLT